MIVLCSERDFSLTFYSAIFKHKIIFLPLYLFTNENNYKATYISIIVSLVAKKDFIFRLRMLTSLLGAKIVSVLTI